MRTSQEQAPAGSEHELGRSSVEEKATNRPNRKTPAAPALHEGGIVLSGAQATDFPAAERFRILRAKIERMNLLGDERRVLAITSAVPEEGKSLVAANLARALAMDPRGKTLLIDCDLRKPAVHRYFGVSFSPGLSDALVGTRSIAGVIQSLEPGLDIITAGSPVVDATRAVELPQLSLMIEELKNHYRYIVVDCPPVLLCPEPLILSSLVDGTILVVRAWRTQKKLVRDAVNLLGKDKFAGVIVNDARDALNEYGYYGYYGYDNRNSKSRRSGSNQGPQTGRLRRFGTGVKSLIGRGKSAMSSLPVQACSSAIVIIAKPILSKLGSLVLGRFRKSAPAA